MKQQPKSKKTIIAVVVGIVVLAIIYFYFSGESPATSNSSLQLQSSAQETLVGARVLSLLNQINSLRIDTSIFKTKEYESLTDYAVDIPEIPVGRANPFAPLPGVANTSGAAH
jgi:hypothetical protein